jgi:hypothetical protein
MLDHRTVWHHPSDMPGKRTRAESNSSEVLQVGYFSVSNASAPGEE